MAELIQAIVHLSADNPTRKLLLPISIRGGGHGYTCQATKKGGLMIDLRKLRSITIHDDKSTTNQPLAMPNFPTIEVGSGLRWNDVLTYL